MDFFLAIIREDSTVDMHFQNDALILAIVLVYYCFMSRAKMN